MDTSDTDELQIQPDEDQEEEVYIEYDIATYPSDFTLQGLFEMWQRKEITIPDFQREFVWTIQQSSLLIESFLLGLPVPPVFFYIDKKNRNLVIDGQQRILSVVFYLEGYFGIESLQGRRQVFRLKGLSEKSPYHNKTFLELDEEEQRKLKNTAVLRAINIRQLTPPDKSTSIYHIFERLNTGGTPLKPQEIRNCVFRGDIVSALRSLNLNKDWRAILGKKTLDKHQKDIELVLRLFALRKQSDKYEKPMKEFLNLEMQKHKDATSLRFKKFLDIFPKAAQTIHQLLGPKPFHARGPLNASILDSVFCIVMENLDALPKDFKSRFDELLVNSEYLTLTTTGTTDTKSLKRRFQLVKERLIG